MAEKLFFPLPATNADVLLWPQVQYCGLYRLSTQFSKNLPEISTNVV